MALQSGFKDCTIFKEFSQGEKSQFFELTKKKTLHHIDTYYYAVFLNEPEEIVKLQSEGKIPENLNRLLSKLRDMKSYARGSAEGKLVEIAGMEVSSKVFSMYEFCVSLEECFDIFIASYLPNDNTPRIVIQLRSRFLVLEGVVNAIQKAYKYLRNFLEPLAFSILFQTKVCINFNGKCFFCLKK